MERPVKPRQLRTSRSTRGAALLIVMGCLVLLSILIVAFFSSVSTERKSAQSYSASSAVKLLAESTVNVVMGQIKEATRGVDSSNRPLAWASQPGMIRTYNTAGQAEAYYKLYSWSEMIGSGAFNPFASGQTPPADWMSQPARYTDLNSPVGGVYPILDPAAAGKVQGFSIASTAPASSTDAAPMPVQWLYVLKDGTMAVGAGTGSTVTVAGASKDNPIVSRIAFWTDDDTAKININTAAGDVWAEGANPPSAGNPGSFWDIPRTGTVFDRVCLAKNQPAQNEFQRYPGHPATTCLSAVFPSLTAENITDIATRITYGGSKGGTTVATASIPLDAERLYASVDELLYTKDRTASAVLTPDDVEKARFFLSAHSRAPEVNLFNQPRIVTWPVSADSAATDRTAFDRLIAHCGTLNGSPYYFQRKDSTSSTVDLPSTAAATGLGRNRSLITYLRNLTSSPIPGFSTGADQTFLKKYPKDRDQILTEIFDYIRALNAQDRSNSSIVSFTPSTPGSATLGKGQIVPIVDDTHADSNTRPLRGFGRFPTVREAGLIFIGVGQTEGTSKSVPPSATQDPAVPIPDGMTRVQAVFYLNLFDPSMGFGAYSPNFQIRVTGLQSFTWTNESGAAVTMGFPSSATVAVKRAYNSGIYGGYIGAASFIGVTPALVSTYVDLPTTSSSSVTSFGFGGGTVKVEILNAATAGSGVLQTLSVPFPSATFPVPALAPLLKDTNVWIDYRDTRAGSFAAPPAVGARFSGAANPAANTSGSPSAKMFLCGKDVVRGVQAVTDPRLIAAMSEVPASYFQPPTDYFSPAVRSVHGVAEAANGATLYPATGGLSAKFVRGANYGNPAAPVVSTADLAYSAPSGADPLQPTAAASGSVLGYPAPVAFGVNGAGNAEPMDGVYAGTNKTGSPPAGFALGDWDNGFSIVPDGAYINKADEGTTVGLSDGTQTPYFTALTNYANAGSTFFSPNRQMPSAVMFGSLPTGVFEDRPWQTLLFRPDPDGSKNHRGAQSPPDHLLLDLFNMPVVEPYAISDPFSTAGKINMNSQIVPFTYITRDTGVRAVLRPEQLLVLGADDATNYKQQSSTVATKRSFLDLDETMKGFQQRFASGEIFRSATEICDLWLVPRGQTYAGMQSFWNANQLVGDNSRERPYADIYPRLTTKSNTYTVHYRVQTLGKSRSTAANQWVEGKDTVTGEYRGSSTIERYLDTSDTTIPDYATASNPQPIDQFYKFRVLETRQFAP